MPDLTSLLSRFLVQLYNGTWVGGTIDYTNNTQIGTLADARLSANVPLLNVVNAFTGAGNTTLSGSVDSFHGLSITNSSTGVSARARLSLTNTGGGSFSANSVSATFTPTTAYTIAAGTYMVATGVGGLSIASITAAADIRLYTTALLRGTIFSTGGFSWGDTTDPGATNFRVAGTATLVGGVTGGASKAAGPVTSITVVNGIVTAIS